ncbi:MAG: hypothetical protein H6Q74_3178 [Firmicutes bacterium]|nr:hypothetical protein [Bacillota bacterium]
MIMVDAQQKEGVDLDAKELDTLRELIGQTLPIKCKSCDNILHFDIAAIVNEGQILTCDKCGDENFSKVSEQNLKKLLWFFDGQPNVN